MSWMRSLMVTSILGAGVAVVLWLVSMVTGEKGIWMAGLLIVAFTVVWFWVHRGMNDPELHPHKH